jgi:hypothetical protein
VLERSPGFCAVAAVPGCEETLLAPDVTSHGGDGIAESRTFRKRRGGSMGRIALTVGAG